MYPKLQKFHTFGIRYVKEELINIDNHFWKDVFHSWAYFTNSIRKTTWLDFINEPIWYNNSVKIGGKTLCFKRWLKKGITHIYDILDQHVEILPRNVLQNTFDIQINFIDYYGFSQAIESYKKLSNIIYDLFNLHLLPSIPKT